MRRKIKEMMESSSSHETFIGFEEPATRTPDNEVPPSNLNGGGGGGGAGAGQQQQQRQSLPSAPRGKPKAPPLIQRKIKPSEAEAGVDTAATTGSGSKIPLLKTKQMDRESLGEGQGKMSHSNVRIHGSTRQGVQDLHKPRKSKDGKTSTTERVHRSVEKVKVSKGIEMNRVVQESNGVTTKRFSSTGLPTTSTSRTFNETSQRSRSADKIATTRKKMTKSEATCQEVKSFTAIRNTRSTVTAASGKPPHLNKPKESASATTMRDSTENQQTLDEKAATDAASNFKTVEEFLKMPETALPDGNSNSNPKKTLYKSKFWEYIDPSGKASSVTKCKQPKKSYNPDEVKSFMEKQKEIRRLQHIKDSKEKQLETEKRQRMLKELDSKCHRIAVKGKHKDESQPQPHIQNLAVNQAKKRKMELESPSLKYLKPLLEHKHSTLRRRSDNFRVDTAKQAQFLLSEFENIVKRECISFLHRIPLPSDTNMTSPPEKVDKAVGTSIAEEDSKSEDITIITSGKQESSEVTVSGTTKKFPSPASVEKAVTKIQAFYRGNKVRKALREAKIQLRRPWNKSQESQQQQQSKRRRWSFPKLPEKPYDNISIHGRLLPMSPVPMTGMSVDPLIPCYIPPPPPSASLQASRSPPRPKVLPSSPFTPVKLRVYDDPYPKQAIRTLESPTPPSTETAVRPIRHSLPKDTAFDDFVIPTPLPSIVDVLREKIRLFSTSGDLALLVPPEITTERKQPNSVQEIPPTTEATNKAAPAAQVPILGDVIHPASQQIQRDDKESETTPKMRRPKRRSRTRSNRRSPSPVGDSTTTADTDLEYLGGATQSHSIANLSTSQKQTPNSSCRSEGSIPSSVVEPSSVSSSLGAFLAPALRLRYEAEREHLKIIEKALQVKLHDSRMAGESTKLGPNESPKERVMKSSPESDRVQLAIANCHKESMKAAAEMAKWMADFQKSTQQQDKPQQTTVDLAAMVYAAVEEARIMGEEKRREKQLHQALQSESKSNHILLQQVPPLKSTSQKAEDMAKVDKSVETSLTLLKGDQIFKEPEAIMLPDSECTGRDYQQQFPSASESERESPAPVPLSVSSISAHVSKISTVLEDYSNSVMFEKEDESAQQVSPPPSTSSTIKSTSVLSEEDEVVNEIPKTDPVLSLQTSVADSSIREAEIIHESLVDDKQEEKSKDEEIQEMLSESEIQSDKVLSLVQSPDVSYAVDANDNDEKSNEVSMAPVISNEIESTEKNDGGPVASLIPEESMKDDQEQFPSTFESDAESPIPSNQSIEVDIGANESIQHESIKSISPILSVKDDDVASTKSEGQVDEENEGIPMSAKISPPGSATYSIESRSLSASPQLEVVEDVQEDEHNDLVSEKISDAEESKSQEAAATSVHQIENLESPVDTPELILPNYSNIKNEEEVIMEDIEESIQIPEESLQDSQQHVSSEFESEDASQSQAVSKDEKEITSVVADESKEKNKLVNENLEESKSPEQPEIQEVIEMSIPMMKPPPPYSSPSSQRTSSPSVPSQESEPVALEAEEDIADAEGIHISLNESPQLDTSREDDAANRSINASFENKATPTAQVEHEDDEEPVPSSEFFTFHSSTAGVPESEFARPDTQETKTELDIPMKPPPPYSPSSSLDSTSLSSRSLIISLQKDRIERIVQEQVDLVWSVWSAGNVVGESFPDIDTIMNEMSSETKHQQDQSIEVGRNGNPDLTQSAIQNFDSLLHHLVYETIKEILLVENSFTSYIERVRPGPLALQAQKLKIPKTKESLISSVIKRVSSAIPSSFFTDPYVHTIEKYRGKKWCSRQKELVDEILLEELVEEDFQWTEWWPEQVIVEHIESKEIIKGLISSVLKNRKYVYSQ